MSKLQSQVLEFHRAFDQPVREHPGVPADERVRLRARLIAEEFFEVLGAMFNITMAEWAQEQVEKIIEECPVKVDMAELADGLADLDYVVEGTRLEFGLDGDPIAAEVHRSNITKAVRCDACDGKGHGTYRNPDGSTYPGECPNCDGLKFIVLKREDGKALKPAGWTAPDIHRELHLQTQRETTLAEIIAARLLFGYE